MTKNLQDMSDKMFRVTDELTGIYDDNKDKTAEDLTEDISDSDADDKSNGKTVRSINRGKVHGDLNVGGIVGSMAIEFDFDPEDDVSKRGDKSLNFVYKTKGGCARVYEPRQRQRKEKLRRRNMRQGGFGKYNRLACMR